MANNIEMQILRSDGQYLILYPKTDYNILLNKPTITKVTSGTTALTPGSSTLNTGEIYLMYE